MGLTACVAPVWSQRRLFPCSVVSIMCKDASWEDQPTAMSVWRTDKPCLCLPRCSHCPAGACAPLLCCGSWPRSLLRQKVGLLADGRSHHFCRICYLMFIQVAISISLSQMEMAVLIHCTCSSPPHLSSLPPKLPYCFSTCVLSGLKI